MIYSIIFLEFQCKIPLWAGGGRAGTSRPQLLGPAQSSCQVSGLIGIPKGDVVSGWTYRYSAWATRTIADVTTTRTPVHPAPRITHLTCQVNSETAPPPFPFVLSQDLSPLSPHISFISLRYCNYTSYISKIVNKTLCKYFTHRGLNFILSNSYWTKLEMVTVRGNDKGRHSDWQRKAVEGISIPE